MSIDGQVSGLFERGKPAEPPQGHPPYGEAPPCAAQVCEQSMPKVLDHRPLPGQVERTTRSVEDRSGTPIVDPLNPRFVWRRSDLPEELVQPDYEDREAATRNATCKPTTSEVRETATRSATWKPTANLSGESEPSRQKSNAEVHTVNKPIPTGLNQVRAKTETDNNVDYDQLGSGDDESENGSEEE